MWAPSATESPSHLSTVLDVVDKLTKILAVIIGALWAYLNYIRGRTFKRRLEPTISGKTIRSKGVRFLSGLAQVKNVGLSKVRITQRGTAIVVTAIAMESKEQAPAQLKSEELEVRSLFEAHGWIEPGEQIQESFLTLVPNDQQYVAIQLRLRIISEGIEWNGDSIVELTSADRSFAPVEIPAPYLPLSMLRLDLSATQNSEDEQKTADIELKKKTGPA